jgi:hypothetical protein
LDGQRVRSLTKGYLRGWLDFNYTLKTSKLREEVILYNIEQEEYEQVLQTRLLRDAVLVAGAYEKTEKMFKDINRTFELYLGLKLPDLAKELKIGNKALPSSQSLTEMRKILDAAKAAPPKSK